MQADPGGFFEQAAALVGFQCQRGIHQTLPDDGVGALGQTGLGQQLGDIAQAHTLPVDQVFVRPIAVSPAGDGHFAEIDRQPAVAVVEGDGSRGHARRGRFSEPEKIISSVFRARSRL